MLQGYVSDVDVAAAQTALKTPNGAHAAAGGAEEKKEPVTKRDHIDAAADLMSDIQVETYSSMDKREKTDL